MIFLDRERLCDHYFWTVITLKRMLFKENPSKHTSCFQIKNFRRFLEIIFFHLSPISRADSGTIQFSRDFPVIAIDDIYNLDVSFFIFSSFVIKFNCSLWFFLMWVWLLFIIVYIGLFFYNKIGSIISESEGHPLQIL